MKIVLITSGQPSLNPRLVKEADALSSAGYEVTVLYAYWNDWGTEFDQKLLNSRKWKAIRVGGDPKQRRLTYLVSKIIHKLAITICKNISLNHFADFAISRSTYWLQRAASSHPADLYIAHNLGALPAAIKTAKLHGSVCGFDAEDFHRNEVTNDPHNFDVILKTYIENRYIPMTDYLTVSSPQIAVAYRNLFPSKDPIVILNTFNKSENIKVQKGETNTPIKLFWFSQTVGTNRGIEDAIKALNMIDRKGFELHLMGRLQNKTLKEQFRQQARDLSLHFYDPVAPDDLIKFSSQFDLGLALEPAFSFNNDSALSNKIFTYIQAGLAIIASNTTAQRALLEKSPDIGKLYEAGNPSSLSKILIYYLENRDELFKAREAALRVAHTTLNWKEEQTKFLKVIQAFRH